MQFQPNCTRWCENVGCLLITIQNQPIELLDLLQQKISNMSDFYQTDIYNDTQSKFSVYGITFLYLSEVIDSPPPQVLLTKIYCTEQPFTNNKCVVQFPIFLADNDIYKLKTLHLYETFESEQIWIQYYYFIDNNGAYKICDSVQPFINWYDILNLSPHIAIVRNSANDGNVIRHKVKTVAFTELSKNQSYAFRIKQMTNYFQFETKPDRLKTFLMISLSIQHNTAKKHFETLINEINRHILNNINDRNNRYKADELRNHKYIDYDTQMTANKGWNLPNHWTANRNIKIHKTNVKVHDCLSVDSNGNVHSRPCVLSLSLDKVAKKSTSYKHIANQYNSHIACNYNKNEEDNKNNSDMNKNNKNAPCPYDEYDYSDEDESEYDGYAPTQQLQPVSFADIESVASKEHKSNFHPSPTPSPSSHVQHGYKSYNDNIKDNITVSTVIDDNLSSFQPGASKEQNKELQKNRQQKIVNGYHSDNGNDNPDYKGYILQSRINTKKFALIVAVDYNRNECPYKIIDCDDSEVWIFIETYRFAFCVDICDDEQVTDEHRLPIIRQLTAKQILYIMKIIQHRPREKT